MSTSSPPVKKPDPARQVVTWLALILALLFLASRLARYGRQSPLVIGDFIEYWSAGHLCLQGEDPYDLAQLEEVQRAVGSTKPRPLLMHNPPWLLSVVLPFALLDYSISGLAWLLFLLASLVLSADLIWRISGYPLSRRWVAWLLTVCFVPSLFALNIGQISPLLLGLSLFLHCAEWERWGWAGIALILVTAKPQLLHLFWIALALWAVRCRQWWLVVGGTVGLGLTLLVPLLFCPNLLGDYAQASLAHPPKRWMTPTWGAALRLQFGWQRMWLQFVPPLVGVGWLAYVWTRHPTWIWRERLAMLLFVSLLTTAYGWAHDQVVLLIPVVQAAGLLLFRCASTFPWGLAVGYGLINVMALGVHFLRVGEFWFIWMVPAWWGWYTLVLRWAARQRLLLEVET